MMEIVALLFWIGLAIIVGVAADTRARNGAGWFLLAILISPLLAGLLLLALPRFRPDGMIENTPYRVLRKGEVEAMMQGGLVRFRNLDQLRSMINPQEPAEETEPGSGFRNRTGGIPYEINPDSTVTAKTPVGVRTFGSWDEFLRAIRQKSWEPSR
jgi:hypothetical protein